MLATSTARRRCRALLAGSSSTPTPDPGGAVAWRRGTAPCRDVPRERIAPGSSTSLITDPAWQGHRDPAPTIGATATPTTNREEIVNPPRHPSTCEIAGGRIYMVYFARPIRRPKPTLSTPSARLRQIAHIYVE